MTYNIHTLTFRAEMYTCCPICKTNFNVTEAQLQVAQGKVRCGSCKNVFNARQHINYRSPVPKQTTPSTAKPNIQQNTEAKTRSETAPVSNHIARDKHTSQPPNRVAQPQSAAASLNKQTDTPVTPKQHPESQKTDVDINISAIFNALDTQLSQGTYLDIATPDKVDIREAAFDDIFKADDDLVLNQNNSLPVNSEIDLDLDVPEERSRDDINDSSVNPVAKKTLNESNTFKPLNHIHAQHRSADISMPEKTEFEDSMENIQQHTFDFKSPDKDPELTAKNNPKRASVNQSLNRNSTEHNAQQAERAALHKAIDNIIKVDNKITTPFEENDAHHFVIEVETEPDVQLVDENDLDKLFASTDSLRISDLKFDKYKSTKEKQAQTKTQNKVKTEAEPDLKQEAEDNELSAFNNLIEKNIKPDIFSTDSLTTSDFNTDDFNPDYIEPEHADDDSFNLEDQLDDTDFDREFAEDTDPNYLEEEIILSSPEIDNPIPHRLRETTGSSAQPPASIAKRLVYFLAVIIFTALIGLQLILFKSTSIANMLPALQPLLVSVCQSLPCRYTGSHNSKQIKILNRDVRLHPKIKGALLISATIINQANYTQPYPTILLKFTDLTGATVAQRYFQPKEYLGLLNKPFAMMPSKQPVQLNIEILDPGNDAINFQFFFL